jgi:cation transporter-like permease
MSLESGPSRITESLPPLDESLLIEEYQALRDEITKRSEAQAQLMTVTIAGLGALATVAFQSQKAAIVLAYPVLVLFLARAWAAEESGMRLASAYIRHRIEIRTSRPDLKWEHFIVRHRADRKAFYAAAKGLFTVIDLAAIVAGIVTQIQASQNDLGLIIQQARAGGPLSHVLTGTTVLGFVLFFLVLLVAVASVIVTHRELASFPEYDELFDEKSPT